MNPWRGVANQPRGIWVIFAATLINRSGTMAIPYLVLYLTQKLGFSPSKAGLALAVYGLGSFVSGPLAGGLSDRFGPVRLIQCSLIGSGVLLVLLPWVQDFLAILIVALFWALIGEAYRPASSALVSDLVRPDQRKAAFALYRLAANLGMSIGPFLGGILVTRISYASLFWIDGGTSILAGLVWLFAHSIVKPAAPHEQSGSHSATVAENSKDASRERRALIRDRALVYFLASYVPVTMVFFQFEGALPLFMVEDLHLSELSYGAVFLVNTVLIILFEVPLNFAMNGWSHRASLSLGALLTALGFGGLIFVNGALGVALTIVVWTVGEMILMPSSAAYVAEIAAPGRRGGYMGAYHMCFSVAFGLGPWIGTLLFDQFGASTVWSVAFVAGTLSALLLSRLSTRR